MKPSEKIVPRVIRPCAWCGQHVFADDLAFIERIENERRIVMTIHKDHLAQFLRSNEQSGWRELS